MRRSSLLGWRRDGFTLLETIVVLALIGMMAGMASQLLRPPSDHLRLEGATRSFCATLRATRARAIATNAEAAVVIDVFNKTYSSPAGGEGKLPADATITLDIANSQQMSGAAGAITFFPDGSSTGGSVQLQMPGAQGVVNVNWLTGGAKCALG